MNSILSCKSARIRLFGSIYVFIAIASLVQQFIFVVCLKCDLSRKLNMNKIHILVEEFTTMCEFVSRIFLLTAPEASLDLVDLSQLTANRTPTKWHTLRRYMTFQQ